MFALDLFNTDYERRLMEGGVDTLEQRRIDDLAMKMDELAARAKEPAYQKNPAALAGLKKQFAKLKDERDSYYRVREAGIPGNVPVEKIPGKEDLLKGRGRTYYEATGDDKFDSMMGRISNDPWTQLNSDPNWLYEIEELVDQQIEPWLLAMEKSGMPITQDNETLNPSWRKRYEQVANKLAQQFLTSRGLNPRDPDLVGKIRYAIDDLTDQSRNVAGQLSAYSDLPLQRYASAFDADGQTANMRDAMAGVGSRDDDEDDGYASRPRPAADPRRLDPGNMEEGNFVVANKPEGPEEKEKRNADGQARTAEIARDHARAQKRDILQSYAKLGRMRTEAIWAMDNDVYMNKEQILDYIEKKSHDPSLSALEYMHDLGHDVDGLFKNVTRFLTGAGISPAKIQAVQNKITRRMGEINERRLSEDAVDSKTWMTQTRAKYPDAKFMQAKMPGAPIRAYVNGKVVAEFDSAPAQKKNSALGEKKLGQLRPTLGTGHDVGRSVRKFRAQRGLDEKSNAPLDQKLQRLKVQARRQFPRAQTDDEALVLKLLDKETRDDRLNRQVDARQDAELRKNFALDREQEDDIEDLQTQVSVREHGGGIGPRQRWQDLMPEQMNPEDYEDEDEDEDLRLRSGDYVRDQQDGESGEIFRMQGDPYERRVRILDRDGRGWYIEPSRLTRVDPQDPDVQRYFGKPRQRDMDEAISKKDLLGQLQKDLPKVTDPKNKNAQPVAWTGPGKDDYGYTGYQGHGMPTDKAERDRIRADKKKGVAEGKADYNFDAEDLKRLERIRDLPTLKTQALALISRPSAKPMKPEKVEWFKNALERMNSPIKVIKLMYDLLLSGEGHAVVGSRSSMNPNSYRQRFGEQGVAEAVDEKGALKSAQAAAKFIIRNLDDRAALKYYSQDFWSPEKFYQGATMAMRGAGHDEIVKHIVQDRPAQFESGVAEASFTAAASMHAATRKQDPQRQEPKHDFRVGDNVVTKKGNKLGEVVFVDGEKIHVKGTNPYYPNKVTYHTASELKKGVAEGWSDAMVSRRTGGPRTPYSVYIKGKKWKDFENEDHAQAVANKLRDKFKSEGKDPSVITIAPTDMSEAKATKTRLDPKCWAGKKIGNPKTKVKGGVRVNNCVPAKSIQEDQDSSGVERAILNRIMVAHTDLLMKFGPEKVMQAAEEVAYNVGDVDEIGTSDVSGWVRQVMQILGATP
jgi:hypothetical protein